MPPIMSDINDINEYLLFDFPTVKTDVGIILGTRGVSGTLARRASRLYAQGVFNRIIICGGMKVFQPGLLFALSASGIKGNAPTMDFLSMMAEADYIHKILRGHNIPQSAIMHIDRKSTNTAENFRFAASAINDNAVQTATIITASYHQRRAIETCAIEIPSLTAFPHGVYPFGITKRNWSKTIAKGIVVAEFNKMNMHNPDNYYNKGFCRPVDMDMLQKQACMISAPVLPRLKSRP